MADRTVSVRLQAQVSSYLASMSAAGKATTDLANKVEMAKGRTKAGFTTLGRAATIDGGAVVAGLVLATKAMADFDAKMALVQTLSHATAGDMHALRDAAMQTGQGIGYTASQVADAEAELVKAGVGVKDILGGALHGALTLAAAGQTDVASATETAAIAMTQFRLSGAAVPHIADLLAAGADKALGSVADLSAGLQMGGLSAAQMGLTVDDTVATLAEFAQSGLLAEKGGTVMRQMFIKLSAPSKAASTELQRLGVSVFDAAGKFVGMSKLAGQLHDKLGPLTDAERNHALSVIFGSRAIQGANILVRDGAKGWDRWAKAVNDAGFAQGQASGKLNNLRGDISKLVAALENDLINAGSHANGSLRALTQGATALLHGFADLPGPIQTAAVALVGVGGAITFGGGASLLMIPKIQAGRLALSEMGLAGERANVALGAVGKLTVVGTVLLGVAAGARALHNALAPAPPDIDKVTAALVTLGQQGIITEQLTKMFGKGLGDLGKQVERVADPSTYQRINDVLGTIASFGANPMPDLAKARDNVHALDQSLAQLVSSGHADLARQEFDFLTSAMVSQGHKAGDLKGVLPKYEDAVLNAGTASKLAAGDVKSVGAAASQTAAQVAAAQKAIAQAVAASVSTVKSAFANDTNITTLYDPTKTGKAVQSSTAALSKAEQHLADVRARMTGKMTVSKTQELAHARQAVADATNNVSKAQAAASDSSLAATFEKEKQGAQEFLANIDAAIAKGLDPREVQKLLEAGPQAAAPILSQLVADHSGHLIKMANDTEAAVSRISARVVQITRLTARAVASPTDTLANELSKAMRIVNEKAREGAGKATIDSVAKALHMSPSQVAKIVGDFGITLQTMQQYADAHPIHVRMYAPGQRTVGGDNAPRYVKPSSYAGSGGTTVNHYTRNETNIANANFKDPASYAAFVRQQRAKRAVFN